MLTEKQQKLYEYLLRKAVVTQHFITKEEICKDLHEYYPRYAERTNEHNSTVYHSIRKDIKAINNQPPGEYLLVASCSRGYTSTRFFSGSTSQYSRTPASAYFPSLMDISLRRVDEDNTSTIKSGAPYTTF